MRKIRRTLARPLGDIDVGVAETSAEGSDPLDEVVGAVTVVVNAEGIPLDAYTCLTRDSSH